MLKPWLTKGIMTSFKKRISSIKNSLELEVMNENTTLYNQFKTYWNTIKLTKKNSLKLNKISKGNHYQKYFHEHKENMLKTWNGIKSIININKKEKKYVNCVKVDDQ